MNFYQSVDREEQMNSGLSRLPAREDSLPAREDGRGQGRRKGGSYCSFTESRIHFS